MNQLWAYTTQYSQLGYNDIFDSGMSEDRRYFDYHTNANCLLVQTVDLCGFYSPHLIGEKSGAEHQFLEPSLDNPEICIVSHDPSFTHDIRFKLGQQGASVKATSYLDVLKEFCFAKDTANLSNESVVSSEESASSDDNSSMDGLISLVVEMETHESKQKTFKRKHLDSVTEISCG